MPKLRPGAPGSTSRAGDSPWGTARLAVPVVTFFLATLAFANFEGTFARFAKDELGYRLDQMGYLFAYIGFILALAQGLLVRRLVS